MALEPSSSSLNAATAADYSLSIRPASGGLAFCVQHRQSGQRLQEGFLASSRPEARLYEQLEELYYQSELLSYPYAQVYLYLEPTRWTLVPSELFRPSSEALWLDAVSDASSEEPVRAQLLSWSAPDSVQTFVLAWDAEAYHFLRRTLLLLEPRPYFALPLEQHLLQTRSMTSREVLLLLRRGFVELFLLHAGEVVSCGSYPLVASTEARSLAEQAAFYLISYWRHHSLEGASDQLVLAWPEEGEEVSRSLYRAATQELEQLLAPHIQALRTEAYRTTAPSQD